MTEQKFCYEIAATDFETLPDDKKMEAMAKYLGFLRTLKNKTRIIMISEPLTIQMGSESINLVRPRTFVESPVSLDTNLDGYDPSCDLREEILFCNVFYLTILHGHI